MGRLRVMRIIARMNVGGPAVQVSGLMRHLPQEAFDQRLYTGWCADDEADYLETQAQDVSAVRVDGLGRALRPGDDARALQTLVREIRRFKPHIIHTHTAKAGVLGRVAARIARTGAATVHTFHGHLLHGYFSPTKTRAVIEVERALARQTDRLVAVGPQVRDDLLVAGIGRAGQFVVIPPGLEMPEGIPRETARAQLGVSSEGPVIAFIGRLTSIKRPDRFVEVARLVHASRRDVTFVVAGAGDAADVVQQAARSLPIISLGWRDDIQDVLAASDAVLLTSDNEGTPLSLIQAALAGLPVVASRVGSVPDVVHEGVTGWLAEPTAKDLAVSTLDMLADPTEAQRRGEAARTLGVERYGVARLCDDHADLYRSIARERNS